MPSAVCQISHKTIPRLSKIARPKVAPMNLRLSQPPKLLFWFDNVSRVASPSYPTIFSRQIHLQRLRWLRQIIVVWDCKVPDAIVDETPRCVVSQFKLAINDSIAKSNSVSSMCVCIYSSYFYWYIFTYFRAVFLFD